MKLTLEIDLDKFSNPEWDDISLSLDGVCQEIDMRRSTSGDSPKHGDCGKVYDAVAAEVGKWEIK